MKDQILKCVILHTQQKFHYKFVLRQTSNFVIVFEHPSTVQHFVLLRFI